MPEPSTDHDKKTCPSCTVSPIDYHDSSDLKKLVEMPYRTEKVFLLLGFLILVRIRTLVYKRISYKTNSL